MYKGISTPNSSSRREEVFPETHIRDPSSVPEAKQGHAWKMATYTLRIPAAEGGSTAGKTPVYGTPKLRASSDSVLAWKERAWVSSIGGRWKASRDDAQPLCREQYPPSEIPSGAH